MTGYNRLLARLKNLDKTALMTLYVQAYPDRPLGRVAGMSWEALLAGLLDHAEKGNGMTRRKPLAGKTGRS